jgi:hypothetical protein
MNVPRPGVFLFVTTGPSPGPTVAISLRIDRRVAMGSDKKEVADDVGALFAYLSNAEHKAEFIKEFGSLSFAEKEVVTGYVNRITTLMQDITTRPVDPTKVVLGGPLRRTCNRHSDCDKADRDVKERYEEDRKKPWQQQNPRLMPHAEHCHDECCEDCFGN